MLGKLSVSGKAALFLFPLFFAAMALVAYLNYGTTQEQMMSQVQNGATAQAGTIKEALVNMMVTNESIDDNYLKKVSSSGDIRAIHILFRLDSLHFDEELLSDDERRTRLIRREVEVWDSNKDFGTEVFTTTEPKWFMTCSKKIHPTHPIANLSKDKPAMLNSCDEMQALIPFVAEKKCTRCHNVEQGQVLGAAVMTVPLAQTAEYLQANALRTVYVFLGFLTVSLVVNGFVFRRYVGAPLKKLGSALENLGIGAPAPLTGYGKDEVGALADSLGKLQQNMEKVRTDIARNERMTAAGQIVRSIAHDLRTPMATASLVTDFLQRHQSMEPEERAKKFAQLQAAVGRMDDMMQHLADFSAEDLRLEAVPCTAEEIAEALQQRYEAHFAESKIRFAVSNRVSGPLVLDAARVRRAVAALIDNAEEAMPSGGMLSVVLESAGESMKVSVEDTGAGVAAEVRDTLFHPFVSHGKKNHAGIGLAMVKKVAELHRGSVSFTSEQGKGAMFVLTIPKMVA